MINIIKIYLYLFPILLAFLYPQAFSKSKVELALITFFISFYIFVYKIKLNLLLNLLLFSFSCF